jgi:F-type H+-transporting ATPase subunit gamma
MPTLKEYTVKIARLRSTRKMTRTMKMVSANKLRKAQELLKKADGYQHGVEGILHRIPPSLWCPETAEHPRRPEERTALVLLLTSDRGLCGGFNNNLNRRLAHWIQERGGNGVRLSFCGRRGFLYFRSRAQIEKYYQVTSGKPAFLDAQRIYGELHAAYVADRVDEVYLAYNRFRSSLSQEPVIERILPAEPPPDGSAPAAGDELMQPPPKELACCLMERLGAARVFTAMAASAAGEHGARMTAMDNSTNNAEDLIESYSLLRNRARQAAITRELLEIIAGAEALK